MASRKVLASLAVRIGADTKGFVTGIKKAERQMKQFGNQMKSIGKTMSVALTAPIAALAVTSISAFNKQEKALGKVEQAVKSTGMVAGFTAKELALVAAELQKVTAIGDEDILGGVSAQLLTFTNITKENFLATQEAVLDVATVLSESAVPNFSELKSVALQLGKALNDPIANMGALSRSGIQFSEEQKKVIKELAATNRLGEAQAIMIKELNKQYGGQAKAAANGTAAIVQLKNIFGDLQEEMGEILFNMISPMIDKLKLLAKKFSDLSPATKKTVVIISLLVAAIGPLMIVLGALTTVILPGLIALFTTLAGPIALLAIGLGVMIAAFIKSKIVAGQATDRLKEFKALVNESVGELDALFNIINSTTKGTEQHGKAVAKVVELYGEYIPDLIDANGQITDLAAAYDKVNDALIKKIAISAQEQEITAAVTKSMTRQGEALKKLRESATSDAVGGLAVGAFKVMAESIDASISDFGDSLEDGELVISQFTKNSQDKMFEFADSYGLAISDVIGAVGAYKVALKEQEIATESINSFYNSYIGSLEGSLDTIKNTKTNTESLGAGISKLTGQIIPLRSEWTKFMTWLAKGDTWTATRLNINSISKDMLQFTTATQRMRKGWDDFNDTMQTAQWYLKATGGSTSFLDKKIGALYDQLEVLRTLGLSPTDIAVQSIMDKINKLTDAFNWASLASDTLTQVFQGFVNNGIKGWSDLGSTVIQVIKSIINALLAKVIAKAFDMFLDDNKDNDQDAATKLALAGAGAIAAGILFSALVPSFAQGGYVNKPTLSMVGDNPGTKGEFILPYNKLQNMMGGGTVIPDVRVRGEDLWLVFKNYSKKRERTA